jgi:hypothetical protein
MGMGRVEAISWKIMVLELGWRRKGAGEVDLVDGGEEVLISFSVGETLFISRSPAPLSSMSILIWFFVVSL